MMANQAAITEGKVANLDDAFFQLKESAGYRLKPAYNSFIEQSTRAVEKMQRWVEIPIEQKIAAEKAELNTLVNSLINSNDNEDKRGTIIDELQRKYPDFLKNIDLEKSTTEELRKELEKTNKEYDIKIRKASMQRRIDELERDMGDEMDDIIDYEQSIMATVKVKEIAAQKRELLKEILGTDIEGSKFYGVDLGKYSVNKDGDVVYKESAQALSTTLPQEMTGITEEQQVRAFELNAEHAAYWDFINLATNDEKRRREAQEKYDRFKARKVIIEKMYAAEETEDPEDGPKHTTVGKTVPPGVNLESAESTISGGGRSVKNITINVESLIGINNNNFEEGETPVNKEEFMDQLKAALFGVLNDANAVA